MAHWYELRRLVVGSANEHACGFAWKASQDVEEVIKLLHEGWEVAAGLCEDPACDACERVVRALLDDAPPGPSAQDGAGA